MEKSNLNKDPFEDNINPNKKLNNISLKINELINECIIREDSSESESSKDSIN